MNVSFKQYTIKKKDRLLLFILLIIYVCCFSFKVVRCAYAVPKEKEVLNTTFRFNFKHTASSYNY